jgi:hypothetical protein
MSRYLHAIAMLTASHIFGQCQTETQRTFERINERSEFPLLEHLQSNEPLVNVRLPPSLTPDFNLNESWKGPPSGWYKQDTLFPDGTLLRWSQAIWES